jgi:hypothetical protein
LKRHGHALIKSARRQGAKWAREAEMYLLAMDFRLV